MSYISNFYEEIFWTWKDFFWFPTHAYFSNSLDLKLFTLQKLSQTRGRFMFQLKDHRDSFLPKINPTYPQKEKKKKVKHNMSPKSIFVMFFALLFPPLKWDPGLLQKLICVERSGKKWEPFCKNTSKTALRANTNSCKMFRSYLQGTFLGF